METITILYILKVILSYFFMYKILNLKIYTQNKYKRIKYYVYLILLFMINTYIYFFVSWEYEFGERTYLPNITEDLINITILVIIFRREKWRAVYYSVLCYTIIQGLELIRISINLVLTPLISNNIFFMSMENILFEITSIFIFFFLYFTQKSKKKPNYLIEQHDWKIFCSLAILICMYFFYLINIVPDISEDKLSFQIYIHIFFAISVYYIFFLYYRKLGQTNKVLIEKKLELEVKQYENKLKEQVSQSYEENRKLRHDLKQHFLILEDKIKNDSEYAIQYIKKLSDHVEVVKHANTSNSILNYIIDTKATIMNENAIEFIYQIQDSLSFIKDLDIITIFGNLLDNAIEAQEDIDDKYIYMQIIREKDIIEIVIENSVDTSKLKYDGVDFITNKYNPKNHGLGLKSVKSCCKKYESQMVINVSDSMFKVQIRFLI